MLALLPLISQPCAAVQQQFRLPTVALLFQDGPVLLPIAMGSILSKGLLVAE